MQIELPNEMIVELIEAAIASGISGVVYPFACASKQWNNYIKTHINTILDRNLIVVTNDERKSPSGKMYNKPCKIMIPHTKLPNGLLHGVRYILTNYDSKEHFENIKETNYVGKLHGYRTYRWTSPLGGENFKIQNWMLGVKHGIKITELQARNSFSTVTTRRVSMYNGGIKLPVSFRISINSPNSGADPTVEIRVSTHTSETAIKKNLKELPPLNALDDWQKFYLDLIKDLEQI